MRRPNTALASPRAIQEPQEPKSLRGTARSHRIPVWSMILAATCAKMKGTRAWWPFRQAWLRLVAARVRREFRQFLSISERKAFIWGRESTVILYGHLDKLRRPEWRAALVMENGQ